MSSKTQRRRKKSATESKTSHKRIFVEKLTDNVANQRFGFITPGLPPLESLPTLSLKLNSLTLDENDKLAYEVTCRNVQERPPHETFNAIKRPFLPLPNCQNQEEFHLDHPDKIAYVLTNQYSVWRQRFRSNNLSLSQYENVKAAAFQVEGQVIDETMDSGHISSSSKKSKKKPFWNPDMKIPALSTILDENPLGPDHLFTSSCIQKASTSLLYSDHTSKLKRIEQELNLEDPHLGTYSRIFGFKSHDDLTALKYQDGISIFQKSSKISQILHEIEFADMNFLPWIDSMLALDIDGNLVLHDFIANQSCFTFSSNYCQEVSPYKWSILDGHETSPFLSRILSRQNLSLFDSRKRASNCILFNSQENQLFGGMTKSSHHPYQLYLNTNLKTILVDERFYKVPMTEWFHPNASQSSKIPHGICSIYDEQNSIEFIANYWTDSDVNILANDWKHALCPSRLSSESDARLSCQTGKILYPLSRGLPVQVPSLKYLLNEHLFETENARKRLTMPWNGMIMNIENQELRIHAVNAIGDVFEAILEHQEDHAWNDDTMDEDPFSDLELSTTRSFDTSKFTDDYLLADNFEMPADKYCLNWLDFPKNLSQNQVEILDRWEQNLPQFKKVSFVTSIYKRQALPETCGQRLDHTIKELNLLPVSKFDKKIRKSTYLSSAKIVKSQRPERSKSDPIFCQRCKSLQDPEKEGGKWRFYGPETEEILRIFEGKPLLLDVTETTETSDTEDDDETKSIRSRQRRLKKKNLPKGLPEDTTWTMEQFLQGLDPEMTSTQQSHFEESITRPAVVRAEESTFMEVEADSSFHESMSKSSHSLIKKRKKKKKKVVGF